MIDAVVRRSGLFAGVAMALTALTACGPSVPVGVWEVADTSQGMSLTCPVNQFEIRRDSIVVMGISQDVQYRNRGGRTEAVNRQAGVTLMSFQNRGGNLYVEHAGAAALSGMFGGGESEPCRYRRVRR